jgi:hypothetical protein
VADVENPGIGANGLVFVVDAGVADGHVIACKFGHFGAERQVELRERRTLHELLLSRKCMEKDGRQARRPKGNY